MSEIVLNVIKLENKLNEKILSLRFRLNDIDEKRFRVLNRLDDFKTTINVLYRLYLKAEHYRSLGFETKYDKIVNALNVIIDEIDDEIDALIRFIS